MKILVIENNVDQRALICETLTDHFGIESVVCADSARTALDMDLQRFDAILTDFNLPDASGMSFLKELLTRTDRPVIIVTGQHVRQSAAEAIRAGAADYILKAGDYLFTIPLMVEKNIEAYKIRAEYRRLQEQQQEATRQLKEALDKMGRMAATDPLTGLYNRRHFSDMLDRCFAEASRYQKDLACIMIDLDGYKKLNDQLGHQFGDKILKVTATVITGNLRVMDVAARYGGDEFVILLPQASSELACRVGERINSQFCLQMKGIVPSGLSLSMSMGIASVQFNRPKNSDQLVAMADAALYIAKNEGKNRTVVSQVIQGLAGTALAQT